MIDRWMSAVDDQHLPQLQGITIRMKHFKKRSWANSHQCLVGEIILHSKLASSKSQQQFYSPLAACTTGRRFWRLVCTDLIKPISCLWEWCWFTSSSRNRQQSALRRWPENLCSVVQRGKKKRCYLFGCDDGSMNWKSTAHVPSCSWWCWMLFSS